MTQDDRYSRQVLFEGIGEAGQRELRAARLVIVGCGALGAVHAETMARAGVGHITLVDRDLVEPSNLQRQIMFEEADAQNRLPKAIAAAGRLRRVNSDIKVEPLVTDLNFENVEEILAGADVILDGTDNFETRFLINDACLKLGKPWVQGAVVGSYGLTMTVLPYETPCYRCLLEELPDPSSSPTCDTAGVVMPVVLMVGSIQCSEALKLLTGQRDILHRSLVRVDSWLPEFTRVDLTNFERGSDCPACGRREFEFLRGGRRQVVTTLCGRDAVQIARAGASAVDFHALAKRLKPLGEVSFNDFLLRFRVESYDITVFRDARSIIRGTADPAVARGVYARYIGA